MLYLDIEGVASEKLGVGAVVERIAQFDTIMHNNVVLSSVLNPASSKWAPQADRPSLESLLEASAVAELNVTGVKLNLEGRLKALSSDYQDRLIRKVLASFMRPPTAVAMMFRHAVVNLLLEKSDSPAELDFRVWPLIIAEKPEPSLEMDLDHQDADHISAIADAVVASGTNDAEVVAKVVEAEMRSSLSRAANELFDRSPAAVARAVFRIAKEDIGAVGRLAFEWRLLLAEHPLPILSALESLLDTSIPILQCVATLLPSKRSVEALERDIWLHLPLPSDKQERLAFLILVLVSGLNDNESTALLDLSFRRFSREVWDLYSWDWAWHYLEGRLPVLKPWENSDRRRQTSHCC